MLATALLAAAVLWYFVDSKPPHVNGNFQLGEAIIQVEVPNTLAGQYQGLSDRESLCADCGMLFAYEEPRIQTFVMRRMKFSLDFVFIRDGRVVEIVENVPPPGPGENPVLINSSVPADAVLEINAGFINKYEIKIGDQAVLTKPE